MYIYIYIRIYILYLIIKKYIPYAPIPGFEVGFGRFSTFSQGIWSTRVYHYDNRY